MRSSISTSQIPSQPSGGDSAQSASPFVPIPSGLRLLIIGYVLVYFVVIPITSYFARPAPAPLAEWRLVAGVTYWLLVLLPFMFYRRSYGWLHPLIFGTLFILASTLVKNPSQLLLPLSFFAESSQGALGHVALQGWDQSEIARAFLKAQVLSLIALVIYYLAFFFGPRLRVPRLEFREARSVAPIALTVVGFSALTFLFYMRLRGGIESHILSWGQGRFEALAGDGPSIVIIKAGLVACLVWYAMDRRAHRSLLFWGAMVFAFGSSFLTTGSRSVMFTAAATFLMVWLIRHRKVPVLRAVVLGVVAFFLIGAVGILRQSTWQGQVDWSVFSEFDLSRAAEATNTRAARGQSRGGYEAVVARVPSDLDYQYGQTYLAALLFWVPRALWPQKPRSAGALNGRLNFGYGNASVPTGPVGEAYWNFDVPGIVLVFFLFGAFHRWLVRAFARYSSSPAARVLYVLTLFYFSPETSQMVPYFHLIIPALAILWWMGTLSLRRRSLVPQHASA